MKKVLYWLIQWTWALPQNAVGLVLMLLWGRPAFQNFYGAAVVEHRCRLLGEGTCFSLGMFIFMGEVPPARWKRLLVHEYGHTVQSLLLGPLYLPLIFLPSAIWFRRFPRRYAQDRSARYSDYWTERSANVLGEWIAGEESINW